jgi:D-3-phosphoglycerate dehydrogenase
MEATKKIAVSASSFASESDSAVRLLAEHGFEVIKNPFGRKLTTGETIEHLQGAAGLLAGLETLGEEVFSACPDLKAIARIGIGTENVDFDAAKRHGIKVSNTPEGPTYAVAEMTLAALLTIARRIVPANNDLHNKAWKKQMGFSLRGSTLLLVGYGRIARQFAEMLKPFGITLLISDPNVPENNGPLAGLLPETDIISLHASGKETILNTAMFSYIKKGAVLLNSARGALVDENALVQALQTGGVSWYWGDVFSAEPYAGALCEIPNALLTPHISTYTGLCREQMEMQAVRNLLGDLA